MITESRTGKNFLEKEVQLSISQGEPSYVRLGRKVARKKSGGCAVTGTAHGGSLRLHSRQSPRDVCTLRIQYCTVL
jgi:hypothetical protein